MSLTLKEPGSGTERYEFFTRRPEQLSIASRIEFSWRSSFRVYAEAAPPDYHPVRIREPVGNVGGK